MRIYAHGGVGALPAENSLALVRHATANGADGVEVDARLTADGVIVCSHDADLSRAAMDRRVLRETPWSELADVRVSGEPLARLEDVLDLVSGRAEVIIEVKNLPGEPDFDAPAEAVATAVTGLLSARSADGCADRVVVSSFDWHAIDVVRRHAPGTPTAFLAPFGVAVDAAARWVRAGGHAQLHAHWSSVVDEPASVAVAVGLGVPTVCWTVDDAEVLGIVAAAGVAGVIANDVAAARAVLAAG